MERASRRVTAPRRNLGVDDLTSMDRDGLRQICQVLVLTTGARVVETRSAGHYDEWIFSLGPLWRPRQCRVRLFYDPVRAIDLTELDDIAVDESDAETVAIASADVSDPALTGTARIQLLSPEELIAKLERSPLVAWDADRPRPAFERLATLQELDEKAALLDTLGIRWLPWLALNELPPGLEAGNPQDMLEEVAFRLLTACLRFGGKRYGTRDRGQRVPDAMLTWLAADERVAGMLDCKAASNGYTMAADHVLRFERYVEELHDVIEQTGHELRYMIVLSSSFPGTEGENHPFYGRAQELRTRTGLELVYVRADDLARLAASIEVSELATAEREKIPWTEIFGTGLVSALDLTVALEGGGS